MPIQFTEEDLGIYSVGVEDKIFNYLLEPLGINPEESREVCAKNGINGFLSSGNNREKLAEILWAFIYEGQRFINIAKSGERSDIIQSFYNENKEVALELVDRLHRISTIKPEELQIGNITEKTKEDFLNRVKVSPRRITDYFSTSEKLLAKIASEHLANSVMNNKVIIEGESNFFSKAGNGVQPGVVIQFSYIPQEQEELKNLQEVKEKENKKNIRFYVKTQQNFQIASYSGKKSVSGAGSGIDYRELMIYKILEHTKFGPKASFCVHPFARGVILISTQAADFTKTHLPKNKEFMEGSKLEEDPKSSFNDKDTLDLNGIDLMARVLNITDLNSGNYGRVTVSNENKEIMKNKWKIVDFRIPQGEAVNSSRRIYDDFIEVINNDSFVNSTKKDGFVQKIIKDRGMEEKSKIAAELVGFLDSGSEDDKKLSLMEAVDKAYGEVCEFLDEQLKDERSARCLRLNDKAVEEIKEELGKYAKVTKGNYIGFKEGAEEAAKQLEK